MPPLQRYGSATSGDGSFVVVNHLKGRNVRIVPSPTPIKSSTSDEKYNKYGGTSQSPFDSKGCYVVTAERDVIVGTNPLYEDREKTGRRQPRHPLDFLDMFTNLCVCESATRCGGVRLRTQNGNYMNILRRNNKVTSNSSSNNNNNKTRIVYPIAKYPARLNSPFLVDQRRKSLEKYLTFRPVVED